MMNLSTYSAFQFQTVLLPDGGFGDPSVNHKGPALRVSNKTANPQASLTSIVFARVVLVCVCQNYKDSLRLSNCSLHSRP